jgi:hypothetical protein
MNRGFLPGLKPPPLIPPWVGGGDPATAGMALISDPTMEGGVRLGTPVNGTVVGGAYVNVSAGNYQPVLVDTVGDIVPITLTGGGATNLLFPAAIAGQLTQFQLLVKQGGGGSNTISWPGAASFAGPYFLQTAVGAIDAFDCRSIDGGATWLVTRLAAPNFGFSTTLNTAQTVVQGGGIVNVAFDTTSGTVLADDPYGLFSTTAHSFTMPVGLEGRWSFVVDLNLNGPTSSATNSLRVLAGIAKAGVLWDRGNDMQFPASAAGPNLWNLSSAGIMRCAAGDVITGAINPVSAAANFNVAGGNVSHLMGAFLGR